MITKTTTTSTEASAEDIQHVQGIVDDDGGGSGLTKGLVDWQLQQSVYFPCYRVANSSTVLYLSCRCLVLIFFHQITFFSHCKK